MTRMMMDTPIGVLVLEATERGLCRVGLPGPNQTSAGRNRQTDHPVLAQAAAEIDEYFSGRRRTFSIPLDLAGTPFQRAAWQALADVPYAETISYREQAERIGRPKAVRAIGSANAKNPVPIVLPCHRVIGSDGRLTGFAGGLACKQQLLDHERVVGPKPKAG
jgi:methylated-DNA-[protein]-cysteine S-methyltransferase